MIRVLSIVALAFGVQAWAGELDNEGSVTNQNLQGTFVVRVDSRDGSVSYSQSEKVVSSQEEATALSQSEFKAMPSQNVVKELDREAGASSWYWYYAPYNYYYNPCLAWYGYNYYPYYTYNYGYYSYYYYGSYYRWW